MTFLYHNKSHVELDSRVTIISLKTKEKEKKKEKSSAKDDSTPFH